MSYLSIRKRGDCFNIYAMTSGWDKEAKKRTKTQTFIGSFKNGRCSFNEHAHDHADLLSKSDYGKYYWQWKECEAVAKDPTDNLIRMSVVETADDRNAGIGLLLDKVCEATGLAADVKEVFGERLGRLVLTASYCLASGLEMPLNRIPQWCRDQVLPWTEAFDSDDLMEVLDKVDASSILQFQGLWAKRFAKEKAVSLDITSVSSYGRGIADVTRGYNRDRENLPQINLLMIVSQEAKLPLWYEQLPGTISDSTTIKDTIRTLLQLKGCPRNIVLDRGFASSENISCLLANQVKFTMGIPLNRFTTVRDEVDAACRSNEFCNPRAYGQMYEYHGRYFTQGVTRLKMIDGHRVYLHMYFTEFYKSVASEKLMETVALVEEKLRTGKELSTEREKEIAALCFEVKTTPKRGLQVKSIDSAIAKLRDNDCGYFAIYSSATKDPWEALRLYKLRDGIEKRFDDMKNEEDLHRLRVHSAHNMRSRLFLQFLAQIMRCFILKRLQDRQAEAPKCTSVSDILWEISSLRQIRIENHQPFYKRPTKKQVEILKLFDIPMVGPRWKCMT